MDSSLAYEVEIDAIDDLRYPLVDDSKDELMNDSKTRLSYEIDASGKDGRDKRIIDTYN